MDKINIWTVRAHNTAFDHENKIHSDEIAAAYGFKGGLVPGVTVYGYMIPAVVHSLGHEWLEHGWISVRFQAPFYEGDLVLVRATAGDPMVFTAEQENGSICATATAGVKTGSYRVIVGAGGAAHEDRPIARDALKPGPLGWITSSIEATDPVGVPECLLKMANEILVRNYRLSPWIHVGSEVQHHSLAQAGEHIRVFGDIAECFEKKGKRFAVAQLEMTTAEGLPIASVKHTFIFGM